MNKIQLKTAKPDKLRFFHRNMTSDHVKPGRYKTLTSKLLKNLDTIETTVRSCSLLDIV
jgi:hypothetical protein